VYWVYVGVEIVLEYKVVWWWVMYLLPVGFEHSIQTRDDPYRPTAKPRAGVGVYKIEPTDVGMACRG
jgi:hypothetical protein